MIDATWADVVSVARAIVSVLWLPFAVAVGGIVLAAVLVTGRAALRWLERRYGSGVTRWSRRRAGLTEDARPWACPACRSVNPSTIVACYRCGESRPGDAPELVDAATDPDIFHPPVPSSQFDPSLYRGPGAPPPASPAMPERPSPSGRE